MSERLLLDDFDAVSARVVGALRDGGLVVVPTDTCYAVLADAFAPMATTRVFGAKRRSRDVPLPVVIRSPRQVNGLVSEVNEPAERLMASFWPGPLTIVFPESDGLTWDLGERRGTVALRLPADDLLLAVIAEVGPLVCTGANRPGEPVPTTCDEAELQLGTTVGLYVDGGTRDRPLSTIVDVSRGSAVVLREGVVPAPHVEQIAGGTLGWGARPVLREPEDLLRSPAPDGAEEEAPPAEEIAAGAVPEEREEP